MGKHVAQKIPHMKRLATWNILTGAEYSEPVSVLAGILALNYS